jgi:hypothetical protein
MVWQEQPNQVRIGMTELGGTRYCDNGFFDCEHAPSYIVPVRSIIKTITDRETIARESAELTKSHPFISLSTLTNRILSPSTHGMMLLEQQIKSSKASEPKTSYLT